MGKANCWLATSFNLKKQELRVALWLGSKKAKIRFLKLFENKLSIEKDLGLKLEWEEKPDHVRSVIYFAKEGIDPTNKDDWNNQYKYLQDTLEKFYTVFSKYLKQID